MSSKGIFFWGRGGLCGVFRSHADKIIEYFGGTSVHHYSSAWTY